MPHSPHIPVIVHSAAAIDSGCPEPVSFGVPMPKGVAHDPGAWSLEAGDHVLPTATTVLDRWGDGSIRWMLVESQLPARLSLPLSLRRVDRADSPVEYPTLSVAAADGRIVVDTGRLRGVVASGTAFPLGVLGSPDAPNLVKTTFRLTGTSGTAFGATVDTVAVEHQTALRVAVRVRGHATVDGRRLDLISRLEFFAGLSVARIRCTIRNPDRARHPGNYWDLGDPGSVLIEDASLVLDLAETVGRLSASNELAQPPHEVPLPFELYQDSSGGDAWNSANHINRLRRVPAAFRGYRVSAGGTVTTGLRATPLVLAETGGTRVGLAVPAFWQNCPRAVAVEGRTVTVGFFPGQYSDAHELQGGEQKTHECWIACDEALTADWIDWCRQPAVVAVDPAWVIDSDAVDGLASLEPGHRALVDQAVDGADTFAAKREVIDEYGWRHFGEIYGDHEAVGHTGPAPLVSHYNNQYDPILGFGLQFLRTADVRWRQAMDELAAHVIDIDIYHTTRDKSAYNGGLFWHTYHYGDADTSTHRTYPKRNTGTVFGGGPSADHNYPSGLVLHYFLTGDAASREAAVGLAEYVINLEDWRLTPFRWLSHADTGRATYTPPGYHGPSRSSGNSLNALLEGHRLTGDDRFLQKARLIIRRCVHPHEDPGRHRLDDPEYRWFYTMFLQALGRYLSHLAERGLVDDEYAYARASLLNYARWMAVHEYPWLEKPEKLEFPTETWAAQDIRKADIFTQAARHADGAEREKFLERAAFFHRTAVDTLMQAPTRSLARPVIVLLTSGALYQWLQQRPVGALPRPATEPDYGAPSRFVGQRTIAERRAKIIAAAGGAAAVAAVAALVVWLI
jgi:hypothetical protein